MSLIKNQSLFESKSNSGNRNTYVLKNESALGVQVRLGDVFNYLPNGVVVKSETGMGATTLEIMAERNSIIVEPLRFTAQSKADKSSDFLFVGTRIGKRDATKESEILRYLGNSAILHKKIICVVNSLPKVLKAIEEARMCISDFFLMLDETDSLQLDATYRKEMNEAFEIYKAFPPANRATVTATPLKFSDPELSSEPVTEFRYAKIVPREISLIHTEDYKGQVYEEITSILKKHPKQKIFIALNQVADCMDIADYLVKGRKAKSSDISILCSASSKSRARGWYSEITSEKLPEQINFVTAAYYTGFDLKENYHLIVVVSSGSQTLELSELRYKQIAGRCRNELFSETLVYQGEGQPSFETLNFSALSDMADEEIRSLNCFSRNYGPGEDHLRDHMMKIRSGILHAGSVNRAPLVFENSEKELKKAYPAFDSILESSRLRQEVFSVIGGMKKCLENLGFIVKEFKKVSAVEIAPSHKQRLNGINSLEIIEDVLTKYTHHGLSFDPNDYPGEESTVLNMFQYYKAFIEEKYLQKLLTEAHKGSPRPSRRLNNLRTELEFAIIPEDFSLKHIIKTHLIVGKTYPKAKVIEVITTAHLRSGETISPAYAWDYARRIFNLKHRPKSEYSIVRWLIDPTKVKLLTTTAM